MRKLLVPLVACVALAPFVVASLAGSATAGSNPFKLGQFQPSGTLMVDPTAQVPPKLPSNLIRGISPDKVACTNHSQTNVRANTDCTNQSAPGYFGRGQAQNETSVAVSPLDPNIVMISQNDYRRGDGNCGVDWSQDNGLTWATETLPMGFGYPVLDNGGARHYWTSGGDTSVAFDSSGEAYLMCQVFDRGFPTDETGPDSPFGASAFQLYRSADGGASWSFPGDYVASTPGGEGESDIVVLDKEYMSIDANKNSPYRDRIYVSWTQYETDNSNAIYLAYSEDHGATWTQSGEISGQDADLCPVNYSGAPPGTCDNDQNSLPIVAPNGDVYVVFLNGNNCNAFFPECGADVNDNHNQMLIVKSTNGGDSFGPPVKVGDYYELPDCYKYTGEDAFRACVPTTPLSAISIFRASNYPSGVALSSSKIVIDYGSFINFHSNPTRGNCKPKGFTGNTGGNKYSAVGVKKGCNNDIVRSISTDGGATFTGGSTPVDQLPTPGGTLQDQWWQWTAATPDHQAVTSFYDRRYGDARSTGYMDISLVRGDGSSVRVTDASIPPSNEFPGTSGYSLFLGDYTGLAVGSDGIAHPAWADTRNPIYTFDLSGDPRQLVPAGYGSDIYTRRIPA